MPPLWLLGVAPFALLLASIAFLPLIPATAHWWESNQNRLFVALLCAAAALVYAFAAVGTHDTLTMVRHGVMDEYIPFIVLLFALYVISGGIRLTGGLRATPAVNTAFLAIGAAVASFIGTTGASMVLIRPLLQTNRERKRVAHTVVFFIFLVSNVGGTLLPIGDPPLFLGFLRGVSFWWTLHLWPEWLFTCSVLLAVYFVVDRMQYARESIPSLQRDVLERRPLRLGGVVNLLWLGGVVAAVALVNPDRPLPGTSVTPFAYAREILMLLFAGASLLTTPRDLRKHNGFTYHAIIEVAALFIGIFVAMQIPLLVLHAAGPTITEEYLNEPWHFFWATGGLSAVLDNAPTYVVFFELAQTAPVEAGASVVPLQGSTASIPFSLLVAVSLGSVFMGAMTYIGNGPNFMVKSIAEQSGVAMPSFLGYVFRYSIPVLIPVFVLVTLLFLR